MRHEVTVEIEAPVERVWQVLVEVQRWPEWTASMENLTLSGAGPLHEGATVVIKQPRVAEMIWQVTDFRPLRGFTWETSGPGFKTVARHEIEGRGRATTARLVIEQTGLVAMLIGPFIKGMTKRYVAMEAAGLKQRSEAMPDPAN